MKSENHQGYTLVTGGAGFIGTNLVQRLVEEGRDVVVLDNLEREGVQRNADWLRRTFKGRVRLVVGDCRDSALVGRLVSRSSHVFHFAAQVAVTQSLLDPLTDFDVNARGTLVLLESIRNCKRPPWMLFTSTNKVYGRLPELELSASPTRWMPRQASQHAGVDEEQGLDFHSPYGCSKGTADQYVIDYARSFGLSSVVFRMSCIYGPHQCGNEDQGWVAHFAMRTLKNEPITIYGDGRQVRDVLFVDDLIDAMLIARDDRRVAPGSVFNMGGGPANTVSLRELLDELTLLTGRAVNLRQGAERVGDQRYYVSNTSRFRQLTGWEPRISVREGLRLLHSWLKLRQAVGSRLEINGLETADALKHAELG